MSWRPIFVHEFLDSRLENAQGDPGTFIVSSPPPAVRAGTNIRPGTWFGFELAKPRREVIGVDVTCRVHAPVFRGTLPLFTVANAMDAFLRFPDPVVTDTVGGNLVAHAELLVRVGPQESLWDNILVPYRLPMTLRTTWHTSGQLQLTIDGQLTAYEPAVVPSAQFEVVRIVFGDPTWQGPPAHRFSLQRVTVRVLAEDDAVRQVLAEVPVVYPPDLDAERCAILVLSYQREIIRKIREFMRLFIGATTSSWQRTDQTPSPAFDAATVSAHEHSLAALTGFMRFIRKGDDQGRAAYLRHAERLLRRLRDQLPDAFADLLEDLNNIPRPPDECIALAQKFLADNSLVLGPLEQLGQETKDIAQQLAAGGG